MTGSTPAWRSTVSCPLIPRALLGAGCDFQAPGIAEHPGTRPGPVSLSETAGLAACGETGIAALTLSVPKTLPFSMPIDTVFRPVGDYIDK